MKRFPFYLFTLLGIFLLSSCSGDSESGEDVTTNDYIRIDDNVNSITLGVSEKQRKINVYSNCSWTITLEKGDWSSLSLDKYNGSGNVDLWISTDENPKNTQRSATMTFKSQGITKAITITQSEGSLSLKVSPSKYDFSANGGEYTFTVSGNTSWTIDQKPDWCELDKTTGESGTTELKVKVGENPNNTNRNGPIVLKGEVSATIEISQQAKAYSLTVSTNAFNIEATGGSQAVIVTCNGSWRISIDNSSWCHVDKSSGSGNTAGEEVVVTCDPNSTTAERQTHLTVVAGSDARVETITITQLRATLPEVSTPTYEIKSSTEMSLSATYTSMFDVTEYGFCYGIQPNPTTKVKVGENGGKSGTIETTITVEDGVNYYIRSYAISSVGTVYSADILVEMKGKQPGNEDNPSPII